MYDLSLIHICWQTGDGRTVYPNQFIPLFERNGFCVELDLYMVEQACRHLRAWMDRGLSPVPISVNQSKLLFFQADYVSRLTQLLETYQISPTLIILEILEGLALENVEELNAKISQLQAIGFRVSLDDFGSGYSSLNTVGKLQIDEIKLDRAFLLDLSLIHISGFAVGAVVFYILRVRYVNNKAVILDVNMFLKSVMPDLTPEIASRSIYNYLENELHMSIVTSKRRFTVEHITEIDEKYLNLDVNDFNCLAVVASQTYNSDGVQFEYTCSRHRPDYFSFEETATRHSDGA